MSRPYGSIVNDLTGCIFGYLTVMYEASRRGALRYYVCECICGNILEVRMTALKQGTTIQCRQCAHTVYGQSTRMFGRLVARCFNRCKPEHRLSHRYYDRGIEVCLEWHKDPESFRKYLVQLWKDQTGTLDTSLYGNSAHQLSLDRIDNSKGYCPGNLRFATKKEQYHNQGE